jgi:hypothetical protein
MRLSYRWRGLVVSAGVLASTFAAPACASGGVFYDSYGRDYHRWNRAEDRFYRQWELDGHRPHKDFSRRSAAEQDGYWGWRHR